jgi:tRNA A-37 threonylcarbamoyl transferase component Bud32
MARVNEAASLGARARGDRRTAQLFPIQPGGLVRGEIREALPAIGAWRAGNALEWLGALLACEPRTWLRRIPGRETFVWPGPNADEPFVVKRFAGRLALLERLLALDARTEGRLEFDNLGALAALGLAVPRPVAWLEERRSFFGPLRPRSLVVMEAVEHRESLRDLAEREPRAAVERWLEPLADSVARLHAAGWYHRDLYLQHWIVAGRGLVLLDVGRCRREARPRERWFVKDVAALLHSCPAGVRAREMLRFLARYLDLRGVADRAARRRFARDVLAKAERIAAHEPRHAYRAPRT